MRAILVFGICLLVSFQVATAKPKAAFLIVEQASSATFENGQVVLDGVSDQVVLFSDRPLRKAKTLSLTDFLNGWDKGKDSFQADPPNAAVTGTANGVPKTVVVELTNPRKRGDQLIFDYKKIDGPDVRRLDHVSVLTDLVVNSALWGGL